MTSQPNPRYPLSVADVRIDDAFWSPLQEVVRTTTIPHQHDQLVQTGRLAALELTWRPGDGPEPHIFWESDVAKWIEAASYTLARHPDPELDQAVDAAIELLARAQQDDGYLNVYFTVVEPEGRFTDLRDAHELYCAGHLIEAAVAHVEATGKTTLLEVMTRYADLLVDRFGPGGDHEGGYPGHQEIELALVKLARVTGERRYLELATRFVDERGTQPFYFEREAERRGTPGYFGGHFSDRDDDPETYRQYNQSHLPVREQSEAVGHSVRAMYLYAAMADLAAANDDPSLRDACARLWRHVTGRVMYVTGGLGSSPAIEGFSRDYDLPVDAGYAETCASIGLVFWANRMARLTGDASYVDVLERALFNGVLCGMSSDGTRFFYDNPLASDGSVSRQEWFSVACCPPNLARLVSSLGSYVYSAGEREAVVDLFVSGAARFSFDDVGVEVAQTSRYPWDGKVRIEVTPDAPSRFSLAVRIPGWAEGARLRVADAEVEVADVLDRGYARIDREWRAGEVVELDLPMPPRRVWAHPEVAACAGRVSLARGPLVYCVEGVDNDAAVHRLQLPRSATIAPAEDLVDGVVALVADGRADRTDGVDDALYRAAPPEVAETRIVAIPYYAWNNRGQHDMAVWLRDGN